jgi:glycosyltransferase involved in cell wall biosynthesis
LLRATLRLRVTKLIVFSICKDEAATIGEVLDRIPDQLDGIDEIERWVITDGCQDNTADIAREHGAQVLEGQVQRRLAFRFQQAMALALRRGADIAVSIDGDLQFDPADIPAFVAPIVAKDADFVAADRFTDPSTGQRRRPENMPLGKYLGNRLGANIVGRLSSESFADVTCGFRAYNRKAMLALNINSKYTYTQESFQLLAFNQLDIVSIPTTVTYYPGRRSRVVTSFWQFLLNSAVNILRAFRDFAPLRFFGMLATLPLVLGGLGGGFVAIHWLRTDRTSPYTSLGILGAYLFSLGLIILVVGLLADMLGRSTRNQEKIMQELKIIRYGDHPGDEQ